jgi:RES domain-containing protein
VSHAAEMDDTRLRQAGVRSRPAALFALSRRRLVTEEGVIDRLFRPYRGPAVVALNDQLAWDPQGLITIDGNRWSRPGEPTIYLAGDIGVALAEFARHLPDGSVAGPGWLWTIDVEIDAAVDLQRQSVRSRLSIPEDRSGFSIPSAVADSRLIFGGVEHRP